MRMFPTSLLALALLLPAARPAAAQAPVSDLTAADEKILRDLKERVDGPGLLDYFRKRTCPEVNPQRLTALIRQLGDRSFRIREQARTDLLGLGAVGKDALREAERSPDHEVARRAVDIRTLIERRSDPVAEAAAARLIALRKPAGAAEALLNFLPFAADASVIEEVCRTLPAVAAAGGKAEPAVVAALSDRDAVKRGAAGAALVRAKAAAQLPAVRALLKDAEPAVRLRVALALVTERREADAVADVIETLAHLPPEQLWPAEEILINIAGDKAPQVSLGTDAAGRELCRKTWADWWAAERGRIDMAKVTMGKAFLNYTLVVQRTFNRIVNGQRFAPSGQVQELDQGGKHVRWKIDLDTYPVHAEVVGHDRVLLAEFQGRRVSERDFKGNVKWEKAVNGNPLSAQRLPSGNVFVVMQNRLAEYNRSGTEVYKMDRPNFDIFRARKLRNGEVAFITAQGTLFRIDPKTNKTLGSFNVGPMGSQFGTFDVLPNGHFLVPVYGTQQVIEFDPRGKQVWHARVQWPTAVQRLPNGNTLVSSQISRQVVELDRNGNPVWNHTAEGQVFMVHRR